MTCRKLGQDALNEGFLDSFDYVIMDIDGTIFNGRNLLPKAPEFCAQLRKLGKKIIFLSNDDSATREQKMLRLNKFDIPAILDEVFTTTYLVVQYANLQEVSKDKKIYLVGLQGTRDELEAEGYTCLPTGSDHFPPDAVTWFCESEFVKEDVGAVVLGFDVFFSYPKLQKAYHYLEDPEVHFLTSSADKYIRRPNGERIPGPGALVAAVSEVSGRDPFLVGKPSIFAFQCLQQVHPDIDPQRCLVIGDSLESDVHFGRSLSMTTVLVLSGVATLDDVQEAKEDPKRVFDVPDFYSSSLETFLNLIQ